MKIAYLSLGSNLGDREAHLARAVELLGAAEIRILRQSSLYETEPQEVKNQPWFLNQVIEVETRLFPAQLLIRVKRIEREMGRRRSIPKGPRTIDIDILLFGNFVVTTESLQVPHHGLEVRRFVLEPLAEIAPDLRHPVSRRSVREMLSALTGQLVKRWQPGPGQ